MAPCRVSNAPQSRCAQVHQPGCAVTGASVLDAELLAKESNLSTELIILRAEPHAPEAAVGTPAAHGDEREAREGYRVEQAGAPRANNW